MARLYLVRHGEPVGTWTDSHDPGLSPLGHEQAQNAAERLSMFGQLSVVTSPLRRAQETAKPFAALSRATARIAEAVAEIPTPAGVAIEKCGEWLRGVMAGKWSEAEQSLQAWRGRVVAYLAGLDSDTAIFSHYVAINVAVGAARRDDRVTVFAPTHASITILDTLRDGLSEVKIGQTGQTSVR